MVMMKKEKQTAATEVSTINGKYPGICKGDCSCQVVFDHINEAVAIYHLYKVDGGQGPSKKACGDSHGHRWTPDALKMIFIIHF